MNPIWRWLYPTVAAIGLCSTCSWGTIRKGFFGQAEVFCRLVGPNSRVRYAVRECTCYCDRRATPPTTESARRFGFVTEIKLVDEVEAPTEK